MPAGHRLGIARSVAVALLAASAAPSLSGCRGPALAIGPAGAAAADSAAFVDVTEQAGIRFRHYNGAVGNKYMPETVGSGIAWLDFDSDGWQDLFYVNSTDWPNTKRPKPHYPALYRNNHDGTFSDVTQRAGLRVDVYGMGVAVGDYNNDGFADIYLTCIGPNHLFRNNGNGTFTDVTKQAGLAGVPVEPGGIRFKWSTSAAWCDYNKDGVPDLVVSQYVKWTPETDVYCTSRGRKKAYCAPNNYEGVPCTLYRGRGDGTFEDVSDAAGIREKIGKGLGIIVADMDGDGWPDIVATNDTSPNFLFKNEGGVRFRESASEAGIAYPDTGIPKAGMGIDVGDFQNNGRPGIVIGNFAKECISLYQSEGGGLFSDKAYPLGIAQPSLTFLTFACFFFDYDLDGRLDIFAANGHIDDFVHESDVMITYEERPLLFRNEGATFNEIGLRAGAPFEAKIVGRGCGPGDYDRDGRPDIAILSNNKQGFLWRNVGSGPHSWIGLRLRGTKSTRDGWGAIVRVTAAGFAQRKEIQGGGSFLSQRQMWPLFGLHGAAKADSVELDWPSGTVSRFSNVQSGHYYDVREGDSTLSAFAP